jgi:hypothetical protein
VIGEGIGVIWEPEAVRGGSYSSKGCVDVAKERERALCCGDVGTREERVRMDG